MKEQNMSVISSVKMDKRALTLLIIEAVVVFGAGQPNVVLLVVDDLRPVLGCYGDTLAITPNIDALAQDATVFTRAYAQQALCGPSRTSFLTSRRPDTTRLYDVHSYWRRHAGNFTTLPQYFKENGYHTASAGKVFHPGIVSNHSDDQPYSWSESPFHPPTQAHKQDPVCLGQDGLLHTNIYCPVQVEEQPGGSLPDIETTQYSVSWLKKWANKSKSSEGTAQPFFLAVGYHKPHIPLKFPKQFLDLYPISSVPLAPNRWFPKGLPPVAWNPWNDLRWRADIAALNISFPYGPMPDFYARYIRQGYYAATSYTDSLIGELLTTLDHLFPDTIVAFIGDHGWSLGEHQEWSKFSNFEVSTHVPFIIRNRRMLHTDASHMNTQIPHSDASNPSSSEPTNNKRRLDSHHVSSNLWNSSNPEYHISDHFSSRIGYGSLPHNTREKSAMISRKKREYRGLVELVDLFPTLVDLAGLPALPSCPKDSSHVRVCTEGISLSQLILPHPDKDTNCKEISNIERSKSNSWDAMINDMVNIAEPKQSNELSRSDDMKRLTKTNEHTIHSIWDFRSWNKSMKKHTKQKKDGRFVPGMQELHIPPQCREKKAAFSQYPRPGPTPSRNPDSDQPHTRDTTIMGYSIRTDRFRYTAWLKFDNETYRPDWNDVVAEELYDHKIDPLEDHNVVGKWFYKHWKKEVYNMLVRGWRRAF